MSQTFDLPVRVYYEDTDAAGIVYHARYLHFAERGRTEMLRSLGFDHQTLKSEHGIVFVVQRLDAQYRQIAKLDDALTVQSYVEKQCGARIEFNQTIVRDTDIICELKVILVVLNKTLRPCRPPAAVLQAFADFARE